MHVRSSALLLFMVSFPVVGIAASDLDRRALPPPAAPTDFAPTDPLMVSLGRKLFFDPVLSGNRNIACATCHHPSLGTSDDQSLGFGEGARGLGVNRSEDPATPIHQRIPRNAPALWNKGASFFTIMFHDGRLHVDPGSPFGIRMPAGHELERPVPNTLAAQAILPLVAQDEMAGQEGENDIADAVAARNIRGPDGAWSKIASRVEVIPEYRQAFDWLLGPGEPIHITDIGNSIASFINFEFRSTDSPFDQYLRGVDDALSPVQQEGLDLFYGKAQCSVCHSGLFQTDLEFYSIAVPQIGPGKASALAGYADLGRFLASRDPDDRYRFKTPTLRNITLTGPYGHSGAFTDLRSMVVHHLNPHKSLFSYEIEMATLQSFLSSTTDTAALDDEEELFRIAEFNEIPYVALAEQEIEALMQFLAALEDPVAKTGRLGIPDTVPSGLPMDPLGNMNAGQFVGRAATPQRGDTLQANLFGVIDRSMVYVREGPSTSFDHIVELSEGTIVSLTSNETSGWIEITTAAGVRGYVPVGFVERR